jgi:hypothetical protein
MIFKKTDEYFLAICRTGNHSFLAIGVKTPTNMLMLLRVGKYSDEPACEVLKFFFGKTIDSYLKAHHHLLPRFYRAYSISYQQVLEFFQLIKEIDELQEKKNNKKKAYKHIQGWIPSEINGEDKENICFNQSEINQFKSLTMELKNHEDLKNHTQELNLYNNSCRTTALEISKYILGFIPAVSRLFFISPSYKSIFKDTKLDPNFFYILPAPPNAYKNLSLKQKNVMESLYQRLESIPRLNPESEKTSQKFATLKKNVFRNSAQ